MQKIEDEKPFYEELSQKKLSNEEVIEANQNFVGFFDLLYRINKREKEKTLIKKEKYSDLPYIS
ncbi:MAG: hypothetical protein WC819_04165 [Parcubacteria group bacterium]|jgi:hypothetical protein